MRTQTTESVSKTKLRRPHRKSKGMRKHVRNKKARGEQRALQPSRPYEARDSGSQVRYANLLVGKNNYQDCPYCHKLDQNHRVTVDTDVGKKELCCCLSCGKHFKPWVR